MKKKIPTLRKEREGWGTRRIQSISIVDRCNPDIQVRKMFGHCTRFSFIAARENRLVSAPYQLAHDKLTGMSVCTVVSDVPILHKSGGNGPGYPPPP
jgi:hypothetical protein